MNFFRTGLIAGALAASAALPAMAQDIVIAPEREVVIREYIQAHPMDSVALDGVPVEVGTVLPETVVIEQLDVPEVQYRYVVIDDRAVLVEPETRRIIRILD